MAPPQRRRSFGPVSPKSIYRSLSVKLRGGGSDWRRRLSKGPTEYSCLWDALENEDTLAVQHLLSRDGATHRRVNAVTELGLVPLDVAALTHNASLLKVLVKAGAKHNPTLGSAPDWSLKLDELVSLAEQKQEEWRAELVKAEAELQSHRDAQKNVDVWTRRCQLYRRMRERFQLTAPPAPPSSVLLLVTGDSSLCVRVSDAGAQSHDLITRYKVEWSSSSSFHGLSGSGFISDTRNPEFSITGLQTGVPYYVRVSAYNVRGWGPAQSSRPQCVAPSSWSECCGVTVRCRSQAAAVRTISQQIREPSESSVKRPVSVSRGLKQLFHSSKFVRLLQRGVYLASVFYQKDSVLVTSDEQLPLVEVQCCSASITQDFLWFTKLSCAWQQVSWLQQASSSSLSSSSSVLQNRLGFLRAVTQLQAALGSEDLGQVYFEPLKDRQGNVLLVTLREVTTPLTPTDPPLHWLPVDSMEKNQSRTPLLPEPTAVELLTGRLRDMLSYHRRSLQKAQAGLYVGVLKLCSSVDQLRILVPHRLPNMPCHCRVRSRPHVSREEWVWLQKHGVGGASGIPWGGDEHVIDSSGVEDFVKELRSAVTQLMTKLNVPLDRASEYRVYTQELVKVGDQVSLILLLPPNEAFSSHQWPCEGDLERHSFTVPLHIFELVHLRAYDGDLLSQFCQAWIRLDLDVCLSQQALREALDSEEVTNATERLAHVTQLAQSLSALWRESRWLMDVVQMLRLKSCEGAVPLGRVMTSRAPIRSVTSEDTPPALHTAVQTHTLSTVECASPTGSKVTHGVTCPDTPTSHCTSEPYSHASEPHRHGNSLRHMHSCPELSTLPPSHPIMPVDGDQELLAGVMDVFECWDLLGASLQELYLSDPEPEQDGPSTLSARVGRPVRSLVEWVKSAQL